MAAYMVTYRSDNDGEVYMTDNFSAKNDTQALAQSSTMVREGASVVGVWRWTRQGWTRVDSDEAQNESQEQVNDTTNTAQTTQKRTAQQYPYQTTFAMDFLDVTLADGTYVVTEYEGFTYGDGWNGWATPMFTGNVADRLMADLAQHGYVKAEYDAAKDTYFVNDGQQKTTDVYMGRDITLKNGSSVHVYAIGAYSWTWDEQNVHFGVGMGGMIRCRYCERLVSKVNDDGYCSECVAIQAIDAKKRGTVVPSTSALPPFTSQTEADAIQTIVALMPSHPADGKQLDWRALGDAGEQALNQAVVTIASNEATYNALLDTLTRDALTRNPDLYDTTQDDAAYITKTLDAMHARAFNGQIADCGTQDLLELATHLRSLQETIRIILEHSLG